MMNRTLVVLMVLLTTSLGGCAGTKSFSTAVRAGDTVALAVGWNVPVSRTNLAATITPSSGPAIEYPVGDARIRAVVNMYPDPMSRLIVGTETDQSLGYNANTNGNLLASSVNGDKDLSQTMVLLDVPAGIATGMASVNLTVSGVPVTSPIAVEILPGTGTANTFDGSSGSLSTQQLQTLERASGSVVTFTGSTVPYAIHLVIAHDYGVGVPWVVNPRGDVKNVAWNDTGSTIKVMLTPVAGQNLQQWVNFKFFVAGGLTGLSAVVKAYDSNGNVVPGVTANIQPL